jgi:hypothetical protein
MQELIFASIFSHSFQTLPVSIPVSSHQPEEPVVQDAQEVEEDIAWNFYTYPYYPYSSFYNYKQSERGNIFRNKKKRYRTTKAAAKRGGDLVDRLPGPVHPGLFACWRQHGRVSKVRAVSVVLEKKRKVRAKTLENW